MSKEHDEWGKVQRSLYGKKGKSFDIGVSVPRFVPGEKEMTWIGHPKCKKNVQVLKSARKGARFCPNCKELF